MVAAEEDLAVRGLLSSIIVFLFCFSGNTLFAISLARDYENIQPYVLPDDHPLKRSLDKLFSKTRVTFNRKSIKEAGFLNNEPREFTSLIVTSHPSFPGYIFKLYLDIQRFQHRRSEATFWVSRIEGAAKIRETIARYKLEDFVKVPQKWIYVIPSHCKAPEGYYQRYTILVEEDMGLVSSKDNISLWSNDGLSCSTLDAVYVVLSEVGLADCAKIENIPFSKDGKIAFIDTQTHGKPVPYKRLNGLLSPEKRNYWKGITGQ